MAKVYVSSTVADLKAEREEVIKWLVQARHQPVHSYLPDSETARDSCLADIDGCDLYLLILGHRYGHVPETNNPEGLSITHLEFRHAMERGMPRVALVRMSVPDILLSDLENPERSQKVLAFRAEVSSKTRPAQFSNTAELIAALSAGVQEELAKRAFAAPPTQAPEKKSIPKPTLRLPQHAIVGRDKLVEQVAVGLRAGQRDFAFVYLPGVGKTAVAAELIRNEAITEHFPDGVLWAHLGQDPDVGRQLSKWAKSLGLTKEDIADCNGLEEIGEAVVQAIGERHMLLVADDVWSTEAGERFMIGGPNCARVITTRYRNVARELMPTVDAVLEVRKLSAKEGFQLLADLAPHAAEIAPQVLRQIVERVDGLPIALVLIGKMLKRDGDDEPATRSILQALTDIGQVFHEKKPLEYAEAHNFSLGEVVEASYSALGAAGPLTRDGVSGDMLRNALEALSVLRPDPAWFSAALARLVTGAPDPALKALVNAGLIEEVHFHSDDAPEGDGARYTMHRMIAEYIRTKLSLDRLQALNRLAADYYLAQLTKLEEAYQEGGATSYSVMYRYEDPDWQDCQDNWLYYFAQTGYDAEANFSFLRAWFDGFWWWSCFTAEGYDFCDELLNDWDYRLSLSASGAATSPALGSDRIERLMRGLELLRSFKRAYPKETEDRSGGAWPEVVAALSELRHRTGLDCDLAQLTNPNARHVRALTDIFLAEAERFGNGSIADAETYYREALALFRDAKESWNIAWSLYHLADMLSTCGGHEEARPLGLEAIEVGHAGGDHEVVACGYRLLGDIALAEHSTSEALRNYQLAVERAYRFQVQPENPDPYTIQFYADLSELVAGRLLANYVAMPEQVQHVADGLRQAWIDCGAELDPVPKEGIQLTATTAQALVHQLFPPSLPLERLKDEEDAYAARVKDRLAAIDQREAHRGEENSLTPAPQS
jgi:hypothetical protein